jgi:tryptophanyl-tRNA synthetase
MLDEPDVIRKKFKTAVTDSGTDVRHDREQKPGITNLLEILSVATGDPIPELEARYDGSGYGTFKEDVGEAVVQLLVPIQERYQELRADEAQLQALLARGAEKARAESAPMLEQMFERMGFVLP